MRAWIGLLIVVATVHGSAVGFAGEEPLSPAAGVCPPGQLWSASDQDCLVNPTCPQSLGRDPGSADGVAADGVRSVADEFLTEAEECEGLEAEEGCAEADFDVLDPGASAAALLGLGAVVPPRPKSTTEHKPIGFRATLTAGYLMSDEEHELGGQSEVFGVDAASLNGTIGFGVAISSELALAVEMIGVTAIAPHFEVELTTLDDKLRSTPEGSFSFLGLGFGVMSSLPPEIVPISISATIGVASLDIATEQDGHDAELETFYGLLLDVILAYDFALGAGFHVGPAAQLTVAVNGAGDSVGADYLTLVPSLGVSIAYH